MDGWSSPANVGGRFKIPLLGEIYQKAVCWAMNLKNLHNFLKRDFD